MAELFFTCKNQDLSFFCQQVSEPEFNLLLGNITIVFNTGFSTEFRTSVHLLTSVPDVRVSRNVTTNCRIPKKKKMLNFCNNYKNILKVAYLIKNICIKKNTKKIVSVEKVEFKGATAKKKVFYNRPKSTENFLREDFFWFKKRSEMAIFCSYIV